MAKARTSSTSLPPAHVPARVPVPVRYRPLTDRSLPASHLLPKCSQPAPRLPACLVPDLLAAHLASRPRLAASPADRRK